MNTGNQKFVSTSTIEGVHIRGVFLLCIYRGQGRDHKKVSTMRGVPIRGVSTKRGFTVYCFLSLRRYEIMMMATMMMMGLTSTSISVIVLA